MKNNPLAWLLAVFLWAGAVVGQTYPSHESITVNDFAGLISPEAELAVTEELDELRGDTGIEMTVVTLSRKAIFAPDQSLEEFATGLFNQWGIGDRTRNDGILFLVLHGDRETRVELGMGYGRDWDRAAAGALDEAVLPEFRNERYEAGIRRGVDAIIARIARPFHNGQEAPRGGGGVSGLWALLLAVPLLLMAFWSRLKDKFASLGKCPQCGQRKLHVARKVLRKASRSQAGNGERVVRCGNCGFRDASPYTISRISSSSSSRSSFGGGRSGGGGASGKW